MTSESSDPPPKPPRPPPRTLSRDGGALAGVRVLDLTDERSIYGAKLLAELGALTIRPEPANGDPLRRRLPRSDRAGSLYYAYLGQNRRSIVLDESSPEGRSALLALCGSVDLVLDGGRLANAGIDVGELLVVHPELVVVSTSAFGSSGPWRDHLTTDLVAGALGGLVATCGDRDVQPLNPYGDLNYVTVGTYAAIGALAALANARRQGEGQQVELAAHEAIVSCLEHVLMWAWHHERLAIAHSDVLPRRGSLHWSDAYQVMTTRQGSVLVTVTPSPARQLAWLVEAGAEGDLLEPKYHDPEQPRALSMRMMEVLRGWVGEWTAEELFFEAQHRHLPYGQVLSTEQVVASPQLAARRWWVDYRVGDGTVEGPGAPYRLEATPSAPERVVEAVGESTTAILDSLPRTAGSAASGPAPQTAGQPRPESRRQVHADPAVRALDDLRVLDFTHVLAGPFATRILGDMGADVVKVVSRQRPNNTPEGRPYYQMWNRNKRSLALDLSTAAGRQVARGLAERADVVIENFSPGVLDRWDIGYEAVSATNPGVIYVQMSGMGDSGPWRDFVSYAPTVHALSGLTYLTGVPGREDIGIGVSFNDHQAGLHAVVAILACLEARHRGGRGQRVDLAQYELGVSLTAPALLQFNDSGVIEQPAGNLARSEHAAPYDTYRCAGSDNWVAICVTTEEQWKSFGSAIGDPAWSTRPRYRSLAGRLSHAAELNREIERWTRTRDRFEIQELLQSAGVPAGAVQNGHDLVHLDPQLADRRYFTTTADVGAYPEPTPVDRLPLRFGSTTGEHYFAPRLPGADNAAVLGEWLGLAESDVRRGESAGTFR